VHASFGLEHDFAPLGNGGLGHTRQAGLGGFVELGGGIVETHGGPGILWFTREQFDNFTLRGEFRLGSPNDRAAILVRIPALGTSDPVHDLQPAITEGYQVQLDNTGYNPDTGAYQDLLRSTGAIHGLAPASVPVPPVGLWHTFEIEALGSRLIVRIDGQQTARLEHGNRRTLGYLGLHNHHAGAKVQFRRLRIKRLPVAPVTLPVSTTPSAAFAAAALRPGPRPGASSGAGGRSHRR
jgi:hypothetical protein